MLSIAVALSIFATYSASTARFRACSCSCVARARDSGVSTLTIPQPVKKTSAHEKLDSFIDVPHKGSGIERCPLHAEPIHAVCITQYEDRFALGW